MPAHPAKSCRALRAPCLSPSIIPVEENAHPRWAKLPLNPLESFISAWAPTAQPLAPSPHMSPGEGGTIRHAAVPRGGAGRTIQLPPHINILDTRLKTQLVHIHLLLEKCQEGTNIPSLFLGLYQKYLSAFWPFIPFVTSMLSASQGGEVL